MQTTFQIILLISGLLLVNSSFVDDNEVYPLDVPENMKLVILKRVFVPKRDIRPYNVPYEEETVSSRNRRSVKKSMEVLSLNEILEINDIGRDNGLDNFVDSDDDMVAAEDIPFMPLFTYRARQLRKANRNKAWKDEKKVW